MHVVWIALRLIFAFLGFVIRRRRRYWKSRTPSVLDNTRELEGTKYVIDLHSNRGRLTGFGIGLPLESPTWIRLHRES